jgi:hypothetical protein
MVHGLVFSFQYRLVRDMPTLRAIFEMFCARAMLWMARRMSFSSPDWNAS